ncbi:MAG TPA: aminopeptidase N, partial [Allosphingosinicella sp.]|nr:aminopeptidase N [Allosphingosinicella sp.]
MLDIQNAAAAPPSAIRREDYRPPDWLVPAVELEFDLGAERSRVRSRLTVTRNGAHDRPLRLDSQGLDPLEVMVDGAAAQYGLEGEVLTIEMAGETAVVETLVEIEPRSNTQLMGLYESGGILCTQCE